MTRREFAAMAPLVVLTIFFGIYPAPILDAVGASVENLMKSLQFAAQHLPDIAPAIAMK
jgi:NADH-quinone oxidoreductase subunit M